MQGALVRTRVDWGGSIDQLDLEDDLKNLLHRSFGTPVGGNPTLKICSVNKLLNKRMSDITMLPDGLAKAAIINRALYDSTGHYLRRG